MAMANMVSISAAFALVIAAMRCVAEAQIVPLESVFWLANLATGVFCGATIFAATFAVLCATFFTAKRRRAKLEAELDSSDDIYCAMGRLWVSRTSPF